MSNPTTSTITIAATADEVRAVRPRGGSFEYSDVEFAQMRDEIPRLAAQGVDFAVWGALTADGELDPRMADLAELAALRDLLLGLPVGLGGDPVPGQAAITVWGMLANLGPVIAGNLMGGSVLVALTYQVVYRRTSAT